MPRKWQLAVMKTPAWSGASRPVHEGRLLLPLTEAEEMVWRFAAVALDRAKAVAPSRLAQELATSEDLGRFTAPVRN